jgi:hypothetical protein
MFAFAYVNQGSHQIAHHVVQKSVGAKIEQEINAMPFYVDCMQRAHRRSRLALARSERTEIMLANQEARCLAHRLDIERQMKPSDPAVRRCGPDRPVQQ